MRDYIAILIVCGLLLTIGMSVRVEGQAREVRDTEVIPHETYVIFKQRDRTIYIKHQAVSGFSVYPDGFEGDSHPVVNIVMGAKDFRFDIPSKDKIEPIVKAFIGENK